MQERVERSWWSRNWKWFVPAGCLSIIGIGVAAIALIVTLVFGAIKSSDAYKQAVAAASSNSAVIAELGTPVEPGWLVSGSINVSGSSGDADLAIPISGPKGSGTVYAVAEKSAGVWTFSRLEVEIENRAGRIDLLEDSKPRAL